MDGLIKHWHRVALAGGYVVAAILLDLLSGYFVLQTGLAICYPPAGLYLAAILLLGWKALPLAFLNPIFSVLVTLQSPNIPASAVLGIGLVSMLSPAIMLAVLRRRPSGGVRLHSSRDVIAFVIVALLAVLAESLTAASVYVVTDLTTRDTFGAVTVGWWISNIIPYLALTPVILLWFHRPPGPRLSWRSRSTIQYVLIAACVPLAVWIALTSGDGTHVSRLYVGLLPILWAALVGGIGAAAWASLAVTTGVLIFAPAALSSTELVVEAQFFLLVAAVTGLVIGAIVTDRQRSEEALRDSEERFRNIVHQAIDAIVLCDTQGVITEWNEAAERITGLRRGDALGRYYWDVQTAMQPEERRLPEQLERTRAAMQDVLRHGQASWMNTLLDGEIARPDGTRRYFQQLAFPIRSSRGFMIGSIIRDVTERKRSEEALRDSEALYQSLVEILPMSMCRKDLTGRFTFVNQRYCREFNLSAAEIIGKTDYDLHPAELAEKYQQDDRAIVASGQTVEMIEEHEPLGGERIYVQVFKSPIYDASGQPTGSQIVFWDVTERKQAEQQIRQQAARAEALAELSQLLTQVSQDYPLVLDTVVRRCAELIGDGASVFLYEPDRPVLELAAVYNPSPEAVQIFREHMLANPIGVNEGAYGQVLETGQPVLVPVVPLEQLIARATPERQTYYQRLPLYSAMFAPLRAQGKVLGVLGLGRHAPGKNYSPADMTFLQDIADRAALAIVNAQLYAEAQERAAQLTMLNEIGQAVSALQDLDSVLKLIYRQVQRIVSVDAFYIGLHDAEKGQVSFPIFYDTGVRYAEPVFLLKPDSWIAQVIQTKEPFRLLRTSEEMLEPDIPTVGNVQRRSASILMVPLWHGERVIGVLSVQSYTLNAYTHRHAEMLTGVGVQVAIAIENAKLFTAAQQELAERKRVQTEREKLIEELEAKNAELERFTYTVSHDLKSPLVTIRGFLGFLEKDAAASDETRFKADMKRIVEATDKMQRLLTELLELSRIGRMMNLPDAVPLADIVQEALALTTGQIAACGVQVAIAPGLPMVYGDRARLVEVLQNLIDNACKFMGDQAEPHISIGVRGSDRDGKPIVFVRDNGLGIDPKYHEKVFGLFDKLDSHSEGTGIGLALVKRIVEVHGGRIWVESDGAGSGSTFCFTLAAPPASATV